MSVIGCQGSQDSCVLINMLHVLGTLCDHVGVPFHLFSESIDRCYLHSTLRTVSHCLLYLVTVWLRCASPRVFMPLCHVLVQALGNTVAVTVTIIVAVLQSGVSMSQ